MAASWLKGVLQPDILTHDPSLRVDETLLAKAKPHHRFAVECALHDLYGKRAEVFIKLPKRLTDWIAREVISDARDLPIAVLMIQCTVWLSFSSMLQLSCLPRDEFFSCKCLLACALHTLITWIFFGQRFILAMHYGTHRSLVHPRLGLVAKALNNFPQLVLSNFWGMPAGAYYLHHCIMHHRSNNIFPDDLSATTHYDRGRFLQWLHYMANFSIHTTFYLPFYALRMRRFALALGSAACVAAHVAMLQLGYALHPAWFTITLGIPAVLGACALMFGNFAQHMFINPERPTSNYGLTVNMTKAPFNMCTFNDGYHIAHHSNSVMHWSEMPLHFIHNLDTYEAEDALVFHSISYEEMAALVFTGRLERLASYVVQLRQTPRTQKELVQMLKTRLQPLTSAGSKTPGERRSMGFGAKAVCAINQAFLVGMWWVGFGSSAWAVYLIPLFSAISFTLA